MDFKGGFSKMPDDKKTQNEASWLGQTQLLIGVLGLLVAIVACVAAIVVVPEVRQWFGLERDKKEESSLKEDKTPDKPRANNINPLSTNPQSFVQGTPKVIRGDKLGRVLLLIQEDSIARLVSERLTKEGLSVTFRTDVDVQQIETAVQRLNSGEQNAAEEIPFAIVVTGNTSVTFLEPYEELYSAVAKGHLKAVSTKDGKSVAFENISNIKGFGNSQEQASANALEKASQSISNTFISQVFENAR